jgi:acyl-CoA thioester hydrolase
MDAHTTKVRVYYEDTDFSGNVYHAAYLKFCERGRTELLRDLGIHHSELIKDGIAFAVRSMTIGFIGAAHIDDELTVTTKVLETTGVRLKLEQTIRRGETVLTEVAVEVVTIKPGGGVARLPKTMLARLQSGA